MSRPDKEILDRIALRAHYLATQMIHQANIRKDKEKGDPKVGGHPSASASALHIMGALHLVAKTGFDHIANKPHASPTDHSYNYLLDLLLHKDLTRFSRDDANTAMMGLRKFPQKDEPVFQSYHSIYDPDNHHFFPSGTVGIPPVQAGYLALAYRYAQDHDYDAPDAHFWALMGDSEFREGSLFEAIPDFAEREIGNLTWIVDYNRQSLDGHRISNQDVMGGQDDDRIERTMLANGWEVIQVRHGKFRQELFQRKDGEKFKTFLEDKLQDYELQSLLLVQDMKTLKQGITKEHPELKGFLSKLSEEDLHQGLHDFGGHDIVALAEAMEASKKDKRRPTFIIAHTIKGWGLRCAAQPGNHSALPSEDEMKELHKREGISEGVLFEPLKESSKEGRFLKERGDQLYQQIKEQHASIAKNKEAFTEQLSANGEIPHSLNVNLKMASYPHTQWMLGQLTAKLTRIANTPLDESKLVKGQKPLSEEERAMKIPAELMVSMAPDVGTSTNLNPAMDGKIFGAPVVTDYEEDYGVKDKKLPDLVPGEEPNDRFIRFEIVEANTMSCAGSFGRMRDTTGVPIMPLMTVYDFFIKRALDQYFYNMYWNSSFILVGTPSGVTLSPEGAQHGWKSDIQVPNQITWEPFFCIELDWIFCESMRRHFYHDNKGRNGVVIRCVTRGIEQKDLMKNLTKQARFKSNLSDRKLCRSEFEVAGAVVESEVSALGEQELMEELRQEVLSGAYYLVDYRGYAGYEPGDNVVHIFAMGAMGTEALLASEELLQKGIYANVIIVTSPDLLVGNLAHENNYEYLRKGLGVDSTLHLRPAEERNSADLVTLAGRRVPIVSVHDGEPGLLDNLGSVIGVRQETCAVRKHSRSGRPSEIYEYHKIDHEAVVEAVGKVLSETALENVQVSEEAYAQAEQRAGQIANWEDLWPTSSQKH